MAGHLVTAVVAVVRAIAAEKQGDASSAAAGKFIFSTQQLTCDVTNTVTNISAENTTSEGISPNRSRTRNFPNPLCVFHCVL